MTPDLRRAALVAERLAVAFSEACATGNPSRIGNAAIELEGAVAWVIAAADAMTEAGMIPARPSPTLNHLTYDHGKAVPFEVADEGRPI